MGGGRESARGGVSEGGQERASLRAGEPGGVQEGVSEKGRRHGIWFRRERR